MKKWGKRNAALLCALTVLSSTSLAWAGTNTENGDGPNATQVDKKFSIAQGTDKNPDFKIWFGNVRLKRNGNDSYSLMTTESEFSGTQLLNANQLTLSDGNSVEGGISLRVGKQFNLEFIGMKDLAMSASKNVSSPGGAIVSYYQLTTGYNGQWESYRQGFDDYESSWPAHTGNDATYDYEYNIKLPAVVNSQYTSELKGREFNLRWTVPDNKRLTLLVGLRNITLNEGLAMNADFTPQTGVTTYNSLPLPDNANTNLSVSSFTDSYNYTTQNNAWGPQVGLVYTLIKDKKWNLNILGKAGIYSNKITTTGSSTVHSIDISKGSEGTKDSATVTSTSYNTSSSKTNSTSTAVEAGVQLNYHLDASTDFNIGFKWIKYGGFATAPMQVQYTALTNGGGSIIQTGDLEYTALTAGITYKF